jgi:lysophospholipase L1-like esterase
MKYPSLLVFLMFGLTAPKLHADDAVDLKSIHKILILGDSITHHGPAPQLGWAGDWGMAATAADKDYVHQFLAKLNDARGAGTPAPDVWIFAEGGGKVTDKVPFTGKISAYQADLALIQLGENDHQALTLESFQQPYEQLIAAIQAGNPKARILCAGVWGVYPKGSDLTKDNMIRAACQKCGATYADLGAAFVDPANRAGSENLYTNVALNWHPSDGGMAAYANAFWQALTGTSSASVAEVAAAPASPETVPTPPAPAPPAPPPAPPSPPVAAGETAYEADETWSDPPALKWLPGPPPVVQVDGKNAAKVTSDGKQDAKFTTILIPAEFAGHEVTVHARVKADSISQLPNSWNGVKVQFRVEDAEGKLNYPDVRFPAGSFDWKDVNWTVRIPENTVSLYFVIGLEKVSGTAWFDTIQITTGK